MAEFLELGKGIVKRTEHRALGLFINGTGLDRATRRLNKKVEIGKLVKGVISGSQPVVARYYTLIPNEDDSRQRAFLDAVCAAGLEVVVKRLPPKGVTKQVSVDIEMASDIVAFALGFQNFSNNSTYKKELEEAKPSSPSGILGIDRIRRQNTNYQPLTETKKEKKIDLPQDQSSIKRIVTIVCPTRELSYSVSLVKEFGVDTITADFGQFNSGDVLKSAAKWIDLSDSETIWRD